MKPAPKNKEPFLSPAVRKQVLAVLTRRYAPRLRHDETFTIEGNAAPDAYTLTVALKNHDESSYLPVEMALVVSENPLMSMDEARASLLDFAGHFFDEYFRTARETTLPIDWEKIPFGELSIRARGWERNRKLEEAADRLLAGESIDDLL